MATQDYIIRLVADTKGANTAQAALKRLRDGLNELGQAHFAAAKAANYDGALRDKATGRYVASTNATKTAAAALRAEIRAEVVAHQQLAAAVDALSGELNEQEMAFVRAKFGLEGVGKSAGGMAHATGSASFAVLSLGQGFQDAGQFGMGMAQGIRAVTNNVQQAFQAFIMLRQQTGSTTNAFASFKASMMGPAGLLLAFGAITAAIEFFSNKMQGAKSATEDAKGAIEDLISIAGGTETLAVPLEVMEVASFDLGERLEAVKEQIAAIKTADLAKFVAQLTTGRVSLEGLDEATRVNAEALSRLNAEAETLETQIAALDRQIEEFSEREQDYATIAGIQSIREYRAAYESFLEVARKIDKDVNLSVAEYAVLHRKGSEALEEYLAELRKKAAISDLAKAERELLKVLRGINDMATVLGAQGLAEYNHKIAVAKDRTKQAAAIFEILRKRQETWREHVARTQEFIDMLKEAGVAVDDLQAALDLVEPIKLEIQGPSRAEIDKAFGDIEEYRREVMNKLEEMTREVANASNLRGVSGAGIPTLKAVSNEGLPDPSTFTDSEWAKQYDEDMKMASAANDRFGQSAVQMGQIFQQSLASVGQSFMQLAKTGEETDMRLWRAGKAFAIANAVVNTAVGVTKAFSTLGPFAWPAAAAIAAAGAAQVAVIAAAQPGGGGAGTARAGIGNAPDLILAPSGNVGRFVDTGITANSTPTMVSPQSRMVVTVQGELVASGRQMVAVIREESTAQRRLGVQKPLGE